MIKIQLMSRGNVEGDLMKQQIIIKNELNNDIMVNRFILNEVSYFGPEMVWLIRKLQRLLVMLLKNCPDLLVFLSILQI